MLPAAQNYNARVMLLGDMHGSTNIAKNYVHIARQQGVDVIMQLGDFGLWPGQAGLLYRELLNEQLVKCGIFMLVTGGNHEDYDQVDRAYAPEFGLGPLDPWPMESNIYWLPRGYRFELGGTRFLSLGGAYSIDKAWRTEGKSWWRQEQITDDDVSRSVDVDDPKTDVMLTHDKPFRSRPAWNRKEMFECWPNQERVQSVVEACRPKWLFHGHLHFRYTDIMQITGGHTVRVEGLGWDGSRTRTMAYVIRDTSSFKSIMYDYDSTAVVPGEKYTLEDLM